VADDAADADPSGYGVLSFTQAQEKARTWIAKLSRIDAGELSEGPYTVGQALDDYLADYERRGGKAKDHTDAAIDAHIRPVLAETNISKLTRSRIETWFNGVADAPARLRAKKDKGTKHRAAADTQEAKRRRRATANRVLTILKAVLNHAHDRRKVASADAWTTVKAFREVDAPVVRYLSEAEAKRLVNACAAEFRQVVRAALLTGCRYGELVTLRAQDFNDDAGTLAIRTSKGGKARHVVLTDEGQRFFTQVTAGKSGTALIFTKADGTVWGKSHQQRPLTQACKTAKIKPAIRFHDLRHTHGSTLAMKGVPMGVIAAQLGHADTRMTEKHYAHLSPSYVAETIRANFPDLGIVPESTVRKVGGKR